MQKAHKYTILSETYILHIEVELTTKHDQIPTMQSSGMTMHI